MRLMLVVGTRPQIIKSAPIIHEAKKHGEIELQLVHTGQHYDFHMSQIFFGEMALPEPLVNLEVSSGTHGRQTGNMIIKLEKTMIDHKPDLVIVPGDTNSTLAGALSAAKLQLPVAHVEAGARSHDLRMPEEINRLLTDRCSSLLFAPTRNCARNLATEGFHRKAAKVSGDTMYDALVQHKPAASMNKVLNELRLEEEKYAVLTLHRPENVDNPRILRRILKAVIAIKSITIVFPVHPRARQHLNALGLLPRLERAANMKLVNPVSYHEMLHLTEHAKMVLTDSGGLQRESFWLHTPCLTLRERTEWIETIELHANTLVGSNTRKILRMAMKVWRTPDTKAIFKGLENPFGDGQASRRIICEILKFDEARNTS